jgi:hypothetical protein
MKVKINLKLGEIDMKTLEGSDFLNVRVEFTPHEFKWITYALASCDELRKEDGPFLAYLENNLNQAEAGLPAVTEEEFMLKNQDSLIKTIKYYDDNITMYKDINGDEIVKILEDKIQHLKEMLK